MHSAPLNTIVPIIETKSTIVVERLKLNIHLIHTLCNGKSSPFIIWSSSAIWSSHARSYIPNPVFLWLIIQLLMTIKPAHKILSLTHRNCWGKPNIWILPPFLQKNKYGRSQLYRDQIFSHTIYLYNRIGDWCLIVDSIWLVWHTYISHWSTHWTAHNIPDVPTKRYFLQKNNSKMKQLRQTIASLSQVRKVVFPFSSCGKNPVSIS